MNWGDNVAHLNITSWRNISFGAIHFYGKLYYGNEKIEISAPMTKYDVKKMNETDRDFGREENCLLGGYKIGDKTTRFDDEKTIINLAVKLIKKSFPSVDILLSGEGTCVSVNDVFWGKDKSLVTKIKALYSEADKLDFYSGKDDKRMKELDESFRKSGLFK